MVVRCQSVHWGKLSTVWNENSFCFLDAPSNNGIPTKIVLKLRFKFHFSLAVTLLSSVSCWNAMQRPNLYQINVNRAYACVFVWMANPLICVLLNDDYGKMRLIVLSKFTIFSSLHSAVTLSRRQFSYHFFYLLPLPLPLLLLLLLCTRYLLWCFVHEIGLSSQTDLNFGAGESCSQRFEQIKAMTDLPIFFSLFISRYLYKTLLGISRRQLTRPHRHTHTCILDATPIDSHSDSILLSTLFYLRRQRVI